ncbi:hypothetical protein AGRA3207_002547 [Actinomadura graeca]|uniref:DUF3558 domain-containing protein n=1 Tax=Actinomadura graeca TaxID=2750812 RepID=A0ABX8QS73_9ACTN|nr:hypothetical protein [Actinomadura graeca]QXJ21670.1 hypothetical protein AGRA3207_002547 [Actinomadura graeca]
MGLPRPQESFERPYSAPDPPSAARRPKLLALLVALVSFAVAAVVVFLVMPMGGDGKQARTPPRDLTGGTPDASSEPTSGASSEPTPGESPAPGPTPAQPITSLPKACGTVSKGTIGQIIPGARPRESANSTLTTCTYSATGRAFRWLRVEAHLYAPGNSDDPVKDAQSYYETQWTQAHNAPLVRTIRLEPQAGIGDQAYRWFKADKGQPTVVGQVTARFRNAVVTVSYSEDAPRGGQDGRERSCLANAARVARETLGALR